MKQLIFLSLVIMSLASCHHIDGSGRIVKEKRNVTGFTGVSSSSAISVEIKQGDFAVEVEADDNLQRYVRTEKQGDMLKVYLDMPHNSSIRNGHYTVFVSAPVISSIKASSASHIEVANQLTAATELKINASSAASVEASIDIPNVDLNASSASTIKVRGKTRDLSANSSSASKIDATNLMSENSTVDASSGAKAYVHSSVSLNANASSGAHITYHGGGTTVINSSSGGSVNKD